MRFRREHPSRPTVHDGRYYIVEMDHVIRDQPRAGFATVREAEAWLVGRNWDDLERVDRYITVEAAQIGA